MSDLLLAEAAKKAFDAKVKENDDFVAKMKKEIDQVEKRAKAHKALETSLHYYKQAVKENEACISKLESDLEKLSELRAEDAKKHEAELETTRKAVKAAEEYCAGWFAVFSQTLSGEYLIVRAVVRTCCTFLDCLLIFSLGAAYGTDPDAERARMADFAEIMKRDNYTPVTTEFALARGLLTMRCAKAKKFAEEVMGATLALKSKLSTDEGSRVKLDTVVPILQEAP